MRSVLDEIITFCGGKMPAIDRSNSNRYCIVVTEDSGTKTAYYFGVPIYNSRSKRLVNMKFLEYEGIWRFDGSSAEVCVANEILMEDAYGFSKVRFPGEVTCAPDSIRYGTAAILPSLNGILVKVPCAAHEQFDFKLFHSQPFMPVRANDRCFSLMREEFKPHTTVSCVGVLDHAGRLIAPCVLGYQKNSDQEYSLTLHHTSPYGCTLLFEINLHEDKLFQDTTVESGHPDVNNAFGGTAFIGNTAAYGEQWLYSRIDYSKIPGLYDKQIHRAVLHLPCFGGTGVLTAYGLTARFCSFGSKWENKVQAAEEVYDVVPFGGYQSLDLTGLITDKAHFLKPFEGIILKPKVKGGGFSAVSTGDSFSTPQILEVNFR